MACSSLSNTQHTLTFNVNGAIAFSIAPTRPTRSFENASLTFPLRGWQFGTFNLSQEIGVLNTMNASLWFCFDQVWNNSNQIETHCNSIQATMSARWWSSPHICGCTWPKPQNMGMCQKAEAMLLCLFNGTLMLNVMFLWTSNFSLVPFKTSNFKIAPISSNFIKFPSHLKPFNREHLKRSVRKRTNFPGVASEVLRSATAPRTLGRNEKKQGELPWCQSPWQGVMIWKDEVWASKS